MLGCGPGPGPRLSLSPLVDPTAPTLSTVRPLAPLAFLLLCATSTPAQDAVYARDVRPFLEAHCAGCHGSERPKARLDLLALSASPEDAQAGARWEDVLDVLEHGDMPPPEEERPAPEAQRAVLDWIRQRLDAPSAPAAPSPLRRLTNAEYHNTLRDLLGIELDLASELPADPSIPYRFRNQPEVLLLGPEQLDRYSELARRALRSAVVDAEPPVVHRSEHRYEPDPGNFLRLQSDEIGVYGSRRGTVGAGVRIPSWPETGEYRLRVRAGAILPEGVESVPLRLVLGTQLRHDAGTGDYAVVGQVELSNDVDHLEEFEFRGRIENHPWQPEAVTARGTQPAEMVLYAQNLYDNGELNDHRASAFDNSWNYAAPRVVVRSIEFEAPVVDEWPPAHHRRILFDSPLREADPPAYLRAVLERFLARAFRRPPSEDELARFEAMHALLAPEFESFEEALRETLALVLIAPQFLLHAPLDARDDYAIASRLSYFLWGSMPDERLFALAAQGALREPEQVAAEVERLLEDDRAQDFVREFTEQWLSLDKMRLVKINAGLFPRFLYTYHVGERRGQEVLFRPTIRDYMLEETLGFVGELVRRNASALEIVDADFAMLNEPLAAHYGVEGVRGLELRPVALEPETRLGGLLCQGSILIGNSTGSAPHPIYRAVWLREAILGDEVAPPPAEVPALVDSAGEAATAAPSIKDLLRLHRDNPSCHDCHARLDPWGLPFERYSAVGAFQERAPSAGVRVRPFDRGRDGDLDGYADYLEQTRTEAIEASAVLPDGTAIEGLEQLQRYLLSERRQQIAENVLRRLLTYALGRELEAADRSQVELLLRSLEPEGYRLRDMIVAVCTSELFLGPPH